MGAIKLSACIEMIFRDVPEFADRLDKVKEAGLNAFEFWGWANKDLPAIAKKRAELGLDLAAFCVVAEKPLVDPDGTEVWVKGAEESIAKAVEMGCPTLITTVGNELPIPRETQHASIVKGLKAIAPKAEAAGITLVVEPLNLLVDHAGYYLATSAEGFEIIREVNSPRVKLLFDIYHQQITEGNLIQNITNNVDLIGHFHMADVPGRHEPLTGEINYENVFRAIAETDYAGYVGMEFKPTGDHLAACKTTMKLAGGGCCCCG